MSLQSGQIELLFSNKGTRIFNEGVHNLETNSQNPFIIIIGPYTSVLFNKGSKNSSYNSNILSQEYTINGLKMGKITNVEIFKINQHGQIINQENFTTTTNKYSIYLAIILLFCLIILVTIYNKTKEKI